MGIIFQHILPDSTEDDNSVEEQDSDEPLRKKKRRTYVAVTLDLEPYSKRPKVLGALEALPAEVLTIPHSLRDQQRINLMWMFSHALGIPSTPMWVGFNSLIFLDESIKQKISYLTTINLSPTNTAVVQETMIQSQKIAEECQELYIQVTYDLAITKIALQIQSTENPI